MIIDDRHRRAILMQIEKKSFDDISDALKVSVEEVKRWNRDVDFKAERDSVKRNTKKRAQIKLLVLYEMAIDKITDTFKNKTDKLLMQDIKLFELIFRNVEADDQESRRLETPKIFDDIKAEMKRKNSNNNDNSNNSNDNNKDDNDENI